MSDSIIITIDSDTYESVNMCLSTDQVKDLYLQAKSHKDAIAKIEKDRDQEKYYKEIYQRNNSERDKIIDETHQILTALGIEKEIPGTYSPDQISLAARIALLIVKLKG
jgi:hypothetical protein